MQFVLYSDMTVAQCMNALNERMQAKGTKSRPELNGWIEKKGAFSISVSSKVMGRFNRRTRLSGHARRDKGMTVIQGSVSDGVNPGALRIVGIALAVTVVMLFLIGEPMLGLLTIIFGAIAYVPLRGDYVNSDLLLIEVERTLKATPKPPKRPDS